MSTALVTGASSGIGEAFAEYFASEGRAVIAVARRRDRLDALAARHPNVEVMVADLADDGGMRAVEERIAHTGDLEVLVNNAGFGHHASLAELPADELERMIRVHVLALTRLTRAAVPGMIARRRGDIINLSSIASLNARPSPDYVTYGATKAYVSAFSQGLAHELSGTGVRVQALCASWTRTEIFGGPWPIADEQTIEPSELVRASIRGLELGEVLCFPSLEQRASLTQLEVLRARVLESSATHGLASRYRS